MILWFTFSAYIYNTFAINRNMSKKSCVCVCVCQVSDLDDFDEL